LGYERIEAGLKVTLIKNYSKKHVNSATPKIEVHLNTVWHACCFEINQEAVNGVVGLVGCINSAGV
jgi:hypothetical protein